MRDKDVLILNTMQQFITDYDSEIDQSFLPRIALDQVQAFKYSLSKKHQNSDSSFDAVKATLGQIDFENFIGNLEIILGKPEGFEKF